MLRTHVIALPLLLVLTLTGCGSPPVALEPEPTPEELAFATEEEALAAATEVYLRSVEIGEAIGRDGGLNPERLAEVATGAFLSDSVAGFEFLEREGLVVVGFTEVSDVELDRFEPRAAQPIAAFLCEDISEIDVIGPDGRSVVDGGRPDSNFYRVSFVLDGTLKVSERVRWDDRTC